MRVQSKSYVEQISNAQVMAAGLKANVSALGKRGKPRERGGESRNDRFRRNLTYQFLN